MDLILNTWAFFLEYFVAILLAVCGLIALFVFTTYSIFSYTQKNGVHFNEDALIALINNSKGIHVNLKYKGADATVQKREEKFYLVFNINGSIEKFETSDQQIAVEKILHLGELLHSKPRILMNSFIDFTGSTNA